MTKPTSVSISPDVLLIVKELAALFNLSQQEVTDTAIRAFAKRMQDPEIKATHDALKKQQQKFLRKLVETEA